MNPMLWTIPGDVRANLFFALLPPDSVRPAIERLGGTLQQAHRLRGSMIAKDRLHNTLAAVHDAGSIMENIERAKRIGARIRYPSFPVRFDWTGSFRVGQARNPLVLRGEDGLKPLIEFRQEVCSQMARAGFAVTRNYTPHVTLLWADRCVEEYPIAPIGWTVKDFVLVLSVRGTSQHIHLGRWQLY
jgi:2'-5' RNA ligase